LNNRILHFLKTNEGDNLIMRPAFVVSRPATRPFTCSSPSSRFIPFICY